MEGNIERHFCKLVYRKKVMMPQFFSEDHQLSTYESKTTEHFRVNIYVYNVITGVDTIAEGETLYKESKEVFKSMSMNLRD